jgi:hypothetical protein
MIPYSILKCMSMNVVVVKGAYVDTAFLLLKMTRVIVS